MFDFTFFSLNRSRKSFRFDTIYKPFLKSYIYKHIEHWPTWKSHHLVKATKALEKYSKTLAFSRKFFLASTMRQSCNGVMVTRWGNATFHHLRQRWGIVVASFHLKRNIKSIMIRFFLFFWKIYPCLFHLILMSPWQDMNLTIVIHLKLPMSRIVSKLLKSIS